MFRFCIAAVAAVAATALHADEAAMRAYVDDSVRPWITAPIVLDAVRAANRRHAALGQDDIEALDTKWRAELGQSEPATIGPVLNSAASDHLRAHVAEAGGVVTEVIVMDAKGLNVAISQLTSDYWQGDEDKHALTHGSGRGAVHVSEVDFDESSQIYQAQVSFPVIDPRDQAPIGAVTVGLNAEAF